LRWPEQFLGPRLHPEKLPFGNSPRFEESGRSISDLFHPKLQFGISQVSCYAYREYGCKAPGPGNTPETLIQARKTLGEDELKWRGEVGSEDEEIIRRLCASSGFFSSEEIDIAVSLLHERLEKGESSGYHFLFLQYGDEVLAYASFGPVAGTEGTWDLYWMAVEEQYRGHGWGEQLHDEVGRRILAAGGRRVYIWTSSRDQYLPTRRFYERLDYIKEATLRNYYREGEHLVIYGKSLPLTSA
jgi:ribosomal protein S18 acetylase RimI-like enzyme